MALVCRAASSLEVITQRLQQQPVNQPASEREECYGRRRVDKTCATQLLLLPLLGAGLWEVVYVFFSFEMAGRNK